MTRSELARFEAIARRAYRHTDAPEAKSHPFDARGIHTDLPGMVRDLFDDGHYAQAVFEAMKYLDEEVQRISGDSNFGTSLMMRVFGGDPPKLPLNSGVTLSEKSEQEGYKFIFAGTTLGIRNPRGHKSGLKDSLDVCLDHLGLASALLRRLDAAGVR